MSKPLTLLAAIAFVCGILVYAQTHAAPSAPATAAASATGLPDTPPWGPHRATAPATQPTEREDKPAKDKHEAYLKQVAEVKAGTRKIDLLFIGDSITEGWTAPSRGKALFDKTYGPNAAAFGVGGDHSSHVLWRITHGEIDDLSPKVVVLLIGANQMGGWFAVKDVPAGVYDIVKILRTKLPNTKVLILGVFPEEPKPGTDFYQKIKDVNTQLAKLDNGKTIRFLDFGSKLVGSEGKVTKDMMNDGVHLTPKAYQIWVDEMAPVLKDMMGK